MSPKKKAIKGKEKTKREKGASEKNNRAINYETVDRELFDKAMGLLYVFMRRKTLERLFGVDHNFLNKAREKFWQSLTPEEKIFIFQEIIRSVHVVINFLITISLELGINIHNISFWRGEKFPTSLLKDFIPSKKARIQISESNVRGY